MANEQVQYLSSDAQLQAEGRRISGKRRGRSSRETDTVDGRPTLGADLAPREIFTK
jgi:hypothetical protein